MCGVCGVLLRATADARHASEPVARAMADAIVHRGPDDCGVWCDERSGIALAHRRLSIVDLSAAGHQPMRSASGRYHLSLNGEIYNYRDLRRELLSRGHGFRGHSDTEVLLAAIDEWGVRDAIVRCVGMFSFALWDADQQVLHLVRDRLGEKPMYYGRVGDAFLFGSELKALQSHPAWRGTIDRDALALFFRYNYVPAPLSIFEGIRKLPAATLLTVRGSDLSFAEPEPYWSAADAVANALAAPFQGTIDEAADALEALLKSTISQQMIADVPLGALLSGGVDSSTVVALMQAGSAARVRTFTVGFTIDRYNEAEAARKVARHLGTDHTEVYLSPAQAMDIIGDLPLMYDEPFADASQIPTHLVSQVARRSVTVALSGDGGDELFGGYNRYVVGPRLWKRLRRIPMPLRAAGARVLSRVAPRVWRRGSAMLDVVTSGRTSRLRLDEKVQKVSGVLRAADPRALYESLVSVWTEPPVAGGGDHSLPYPAHPSLRDVAAGMMYADMLTYLPDDILAKVDRAAMRVSLETRVPFLDHRVVEFAWRIPTSMHVGPLGGKQVLRRVLDRYVPRALVSGPKMGFAIPVGTWVRDELRDWAEHLLDERRLTEQGFLAVEPVRAAWRDHLAGSADRTDQVWGVLMFQAWLEATRARGALG